MTDELLLELEAQRPRRDKVLNVRLTASELARIDAATTKIAAELGRDYATRADLVRVALDTILTKLEQRWDGQ